MSKGCRVKILQQHGSFNRWDNETFTLAQHSSEVKKQKKKLITLMTLDK